MPDLNVIAAVILVIMCTGCGTAVSDKTYSSSSSNIILASNILDKIENNEDIKYDHVRIIGDLDISDLKLSLTQDNKKYINSSIEISRSEIDGLVKFNDAEFSKYVMFYDTNFLEETEFKDVLFCSNVVFIDSIFEDEVHLDDTQFLGQSYFDKATFKGYVSFLNANFYNLTNFRSSQFEKAAGFKDAIFEGGAYFQKVQFKGDVYFSDSEFKKEVMFTSSEFEDYAEFRDTVFHKNVYFDGTVFKKNVFFDIYPDPPSRRGTRFEGDLILDDAVIHSMNLNNAEFDGRISLNNSDFSRLKTDWTALKGPLYYNGPVYLALIKNFKEQEQFEDADQCYFDYRYQSRDGWMDYLSWISCGFGVRPQNTVFLSATLILIFGIIYWLVGGIERTPVPGDNEKQKRAGRTRKRSMRDLGVALFFSLLVFTFQARGEWRAVRFYRLVAVLEGVLGIGLIALFVVTLANIMIRY